MRIGIDISTSLPLKVATVPAFTPASISGLQLWLDASDASTLFTDSAGTTLATADGDPVGCWKDKSGNNYHAKQTDGSFKPLIRKAIYNSRDIVRYDGANDRLVCGDVMDLEYGNLSIFATVKIIGSTGSIISKSAQANSSTRYFFIRESNNILFNIHKPNVGNPIALASSDTSTSFRLLSANWQRESGMYIRINKSQVTSVSTSGDSDFWNSGYVFEIGNYQTAFGAEGNAVPLNGDIGEILIYIGSALTTDQRDSVENYLYAKWGIV